MSINKKNYQEYLLLYADNELSAQEVVIVEQFIAANDFAQEELTILQYCKLDNENKRFGNVSHLLKHTNNEISLENYEEKFLLYADNEMSEYEKKQVETFVLKQPKTQDEFTVINKAKLQAVSIAYPNKKELLRHKRNVLWYAMRISVAAVFAGVTAFAWLMHKNQAELAFVKHENTTQHDNKIIINNQSSEAEKNAEAIAANANYKKDVANKTLNDNIPISNKKVIIIKNNEVVSDIKNNNIQNALTTGNNAKNSVHKVISDNIINNSISVNNNQVTQPVTIAANHTIKVNTIAVVYKTLDDDDDNIAEQQKVKPVSKVKELLNKATKLVNIETGEDEKPKKIFSLTLR